MNDHETPNCPICKSLLMKIENPKEEGPCSQRFDYECKKCQKKFELVSREIMEKNGKIRRKFKLRGEYTITIKE